MTARCFLSPPRLLAAHIPQLVKVRRNWNGFISSLNRAMLIEESLCSLPSQACLASHQLMIMSTINACPRASHFRFFPIINQRKTTTQPIKQEKSLLSFIPSRGAGYPRGKGCLCTGTDLCPSLTEAASTPSYLHLSCGTCTLGQIPSTCACFITEPDQLLHQFLKGPTCSATSSPLGESGGVASWLPPSKKGRCLFALRLP